MEFLDIQFDDSFVGGNWLTGIRTTPKKCKEYIDNAVNPCVGKKGLKYAYQNGYGVCAMGGGSNTWTSW